jgi:membrane protease YdiL (CAAX protease family)
MPANNRKNPFLLAPASAFAVLVLLLIFGFAEGDGGVKTSFLVMILTLLAFGLPLILLVLLRGAKGCEIFPLHTPKKRELLLCLSGFFTLVFLTATLKYAVFGVDFDYQRITLYGFELSFPETAMEGLLLLFSAVVIPAVMEELLLRGAFFYEYRKAGVLASVLMSSLFSAMMGLSFGAFPILLISAILFAMIRFLTGNLAASMLVHMAYGVYTVLLEKYLWFMSFSDESRGLFFFLTVFFFGGSLLWFLHLAEKTLRERAAANEEAPIQAPKGKLILVLFDVFTAAPLWVLLCTYLVISVIGLFI